MGRLRPDTPIFPLRQLTLAAAVVQIPMVKSFRTGAPGQQETSGFGVK